ncbi:MAG: ATP-dependent RNA helicase HrpA [Akkermansiaceae bacterium]|nr:ATP-dependent RNA helicase HrpA [Akkermansiaceae bacterium]
MTADAELIGRQQVADFNLYQVRFEDRTSRETRVKFMTDGILLAESQGDPELRRYDAIIIDEAHERSLNIDFLLGYLKRLLERRSDLKVVISSATLDAGAFAAFFGEKVEVPVIEAEGRTYPVEEVFLPGEEEEDLADGVLRAVDFLTSAGERGDVLVFLPGEREIRDAAEALEGRRYPGTEVLPLYARQGLGEQQRVFHPGSMRRIVLATNVAETSLTIPRIACVVDTGVARVSRWSPARGVQRLQLEEVSQASARQRKGRCGRVREGVCVRLYDEENLRQRPDFTDPEIRRSSLAGVILRMKSLGLPEIEEFPFMDPPAPKAISEGYRTLREVGALDRDKQLTAAGRRMAAMPVDPRLARMLLEAEQEGVLAEVLPVVAGLETQDPRERPQDKQKEADKVHARWRHEESDFMGMVRLWQVLQEFRKGRGWQANRLRKFCKEHFLSFRRVLEWANVHDELDDLVRRGLGMKLAPREAGKAPEYAPFHRALLAGVPRQFGLWDREEKAYRSAAGGHFAVFPGSGLFGGKRWEWVMAMELVETSRLYARRLARIDSEWVEQVAPHLCQKRHSDGHWDEGQGAVYAKETVVCGGLPVVSGRRVHFGRIDPKGARRIFIREGLMQGGVKGKSAIVERLRELREEIRMIEHKLRRRDGLWSEEAVLEFYESRLPDGMSTAKAFHRWREDHEEANLPGTGDVVLEDLDGMDLEGFPDWVTHGGESYAIYYHCEPGARDDGVSFGVHIDQLAAFPEWLPRWGVDGDLALRTEWWIRSLPKDFRLACQPVAERAADFADEWRGREKEGPLEILLAQYLSRVTGRRISADMFDGSRMPAEWVAKVWVGGDDGEEIAFGEDVAALKNSLTGVVAARIEATANAEWESTGHPDWPDFELPVEAMAGGVKVFPALVDERKSVGTRAFTREAEAAESHRAGLVRLMLLRQAEQAAYVRKKSPLGWATKVEWPRHGGDLEELVALAAEGALGGGAIRDAESFAKAAERGRGEWWNCARKVGDALDEVFRLLPEIRERIQPMKGHRVLDEVAVDVEEQLQWLLRRGFAWKAGYPRMAGYGRFFRGILSRLGRLESLPIQKDLEKMDRVREFWDPWLAAWTARPEDAELWAYGWQIEEYRISLFAPDVPVVGKVSEKRLREDLPNGR